MPTSRNTRQKELLKSEMGRYSGFFTAEELYEKLKKINSDVGIATVYRFLKSMVEHGELHSYQCERKTIYSTNHHSHCHFICEQCGKKHHIMITDINSLKRSIRGKICHFQIDVYGLCETCVSRPAE